MAEKAGSKPRGEPAPAGHNAGPLTQSDLDDLQIVHMAEMRKQNDALEAAMEVVRGVKKIRTRHRTVVRTDGFPLALMDELLDDEKLSISDVTEREMKRARIRFVANAPGGRDTEEDPKLIPGFQDSFAEREATEAAWRKKGYDAGVRGVLQDPGKAEVPPEWHQVWLEEWHKGQARLAEAWATKQRIEGGLPLGATTTTEGAGAVSDEEIGADADAAAAAAQADENAELDAEEAAAAANAAEGFEATDEELAAQNPRRAIREANNAAEEELRDPTEEPCEACGAPAGEPCTPECPSDAEVREDA